MSVATSTLVFPQLYMRCRSAITPAAGDFKSRDVVPVIPQSKVLAQFLQETGENCGELSAKFFADFRPSISRDNRRKKFHKKIRDIFRSAPNKVLSLLQLWELGRPSDVSVSQNRCDCDSSCDLVPWASMHEKQTAQREEEALGQDP